MTDKFTPARHGDSTFNCMICGQKAWTSEAITLDIYTGRGGLKVCRECNDPIDYGIVPYKVPAEKSVPWAIDAMYSNNPGVFNATFALQKHTSFDYSLFDPLSGNNTDSMTQGALWDQITTSWEQWLLPWGVGYTTVNDPSYNKVFSNVSQFGWNSWDLPWSN